MRPLRILHLSDLHERAPFAAMPASRRKTLEWDARQRGQVLGVRFDEALDAVAIGGIDLVLFSGDLADWGQPDEYAKATARIDAILAKVGVPRERFYAVPGNHDVQRKVNEPAWFALRKWLDETHDFGRLGRWMLGVNGPPHGFRPDTPGRVLARTAAFWDWFESFRGAALPGRAELPLGYRASLPAGALAGIPTAVHVVGLDSAWLCGADQARRGVVLKDRGSIAVTEEQVEAHVLDGERRLDGVRIGIVHHPLDHLADQDAVRRLLGDGGIDLLLHGHQHTPLSTLVVEPGSELRILAAGCLIEGELGKNWPNGFQLIEIDPASRAGAVHFRKWSKSGAFWPVGSDIYRQAPDGVLRWSAPAPAPAAAPAPRAGAAAPVTLRMESLRLVDMAGIDAAIRAHGRDWPPVTIEWPPSLALLLDGLKAGLAGQLSGPGAEDFAADVPPALHRAEQERLRAAHRIPALVARARELSDERLATVLRNYLLVAAYQGHASLAFYSGWDGLSPWQAPDEWQAIRRDGQRRSFAALLGEVVRDGRLPMGRLRMAEGLDLYDERGSPGLYVWAPMRVLSDPDPDDLCRWFIPQLEVAWRCELPAAYRLEPWYVDKIVE